MKTTLEMKLSDYGISVDVQPPSAEPGNRPCDSVADGRRPQDLALRQQDRRAGAQDLRGRRARVGLPARRPRPDQGQGRRHPRLPQELPDDDLRLVRHAHGRPCRPRLQGADEADRGRGPRPRHLRDGEPPDRPRPGRGHGPVLGEDPRGQAVPPAGLRGAAGTRVDLSAGADEPDPQGSALHHVRLLRLGVQLDGVRPRVPRPGRAREGVPLRRRPARQGRRRAAERVQPGARDLGLHALLLLQ